MAEIVEHLTTTFNQQTTAFKVNISLAYILKNVETLELAFYWSSQNNQLLLDSPRLIGNILDFNKLCSDILCIDLLNHVTFPNSKFTFRKLTNVTFYVTRLPNCPIGTHVTLPPHLKNNKGLKSLVSSKQTGKPFNDQLCFFRCLALHFGANLRALETPTKQLFRQFCEQYPQDSSEFAGICLDQIHDASKIFNVGVNIYVQNSNRHTELILRTVLQENIMHLNLHGDHFSYITDLSKYSSAYRCTKCSKIMTRHWNLKQHLKVCDASTKFIYGRGAFSLPETIFQKLASYGIVIPDSLQYFEYRICFDVECTLTRDTGVPNTPNVDFTFKHDLASIAIAANVPEFTNPVCLVSDGCPQKLVKRCIEYMTEIAEAVKFLQQEKFADYLEDIRELEDETIVEKFEEYMSQVPCLSFNGSKYDLRVCRGPLIATLVELDEVKYVIKKGNSYACIATESLKFLDILSFLAAGTSYDKFLKAYGTTQNKSFFPYEWFDNLDKLNNTDFPAYSDFYSSLRQKNTLEPQKSERLTDEEVLVIRRRPTNNVPLTDGEVQAIGTYRYQKLSTMFYDRQWTIRDFLVYYNSRWVCLYFVGLLLFNRLYPPDVVHQQFATSCNCIEV